MKEEIDGIHTRLDTRNLLGGFHSQQELPGQDHQGDPKLPQDTQKEGGEMSRPVITLHLRKRNIKTKPFHIYIRSDGWPVGSVWSTNFRLARHLNDGTPHWVLKDKNLDVFIHADQLAFEKEGK